MVTHNKEQIPQQPDSMMKWVRCGLKWCLAIMKFVLLFFLTFINFWGLVCLVFIILFGKGDLAFILFPYTGASGLGLNFINVFAFILVLFFLYSQSL